VGFVLLQHEQRAPLRTAALPVPDCAAERDQVVLRVRVCAPGWWDLALPPEWPRVPGAVVIGSDEREADDRLRICGGYLPCGACEPCQAGLHLACKSPARPGWNIPGGLATEVGLPSSEHLAPAMDHVADWPWVAAVLAAGGPTYQAAATAGMAAGDTVVVFGTAGPGAIPLRLLAALGLRPVWVTKSEAPVPEVSVTPDPPDRLADLPSARRHLLDLSADEATVAAWRHLARGCVSCTLVGSGPPPPVSAEVLAGQAPLRWIRDLHPHLVLDLVALCRSERLPPDHGAITTCSPDQIPPAFGDLERGAATGWPVLTTQSCR